MRQWVVVALFIITLGFVAVRPAGAVSPYPVLEERAGRFFDQKEWNQAAAVYDLMLDERPAVASTYGRAVVVNAMRGDSVAPIRLMAKALDNHVPFDSVFSRVREFSFALGHAGIYEGFLLSVRGAYPWMKRTVDSYLLKYYTFRRNGRMMDAYSGAMLAGAHDNVDFLLLRGEGYVFQGMLPEAIAAFEEVLKVAPDNYDALLTLGNWYAMGVSSDVGDGLSNRSKAVEYLGRAYALRPTPYVAVVLDKLK